jgi:hypothetical protein
LAENFGLSQNLRIETGGHGEKVTNRRHTIVPGERTGGNNAPGVCQVSKPPFTVIAAAPVELATIAGGEEKSRSADLLATFQQGCDFGPGEGELFPLADRRRMVAYTNNMERGILRHVQG